MDDLVEVFFGVAELCFRVSVGAVVSDVVGSSVCRIDHMGSFEEVCMVGVVGLCPDVFAVEWIVVELESGLRPLTNDPAVGVVFQRVLLVPAPQNAVTSFVRVEPAAGAPSPVKGVPDREPHSWG